MRSTPKQTRRGPGMRMASVPTTMQHPRPRGGTAARAPGPGPRCAGRGGCLAVGGAVILTQRGAFSTESLYRKSKICSLTVARMCTNGFTAGGSTDAMDGRCGRADGGVYARGGAAERMEIA